MWNLYRVRARLASPLHVGWRTVGNLKMTRPYVPGRSLWGALTCRLARDKFDGGYARASAIINDCVRFSYLFASDSGDGVDLWPWGTSLPDFSWRFLHSYASTALTHAKSKLDGSLHETELLAPYSRNGSSPVWLHGYYWIRSNGPADKDFADAVQSAWPLLQLGGERSYGWGRLAQCRTERVEDDHKLFGTWQWSAKDGDVWVGTPNSAATIAHVVVDDETSATGSFEVVVSRTTDMEGKAGQFGRTLTKAEICWAPGSSFSDDGGFRIGSYGLWRLWNAPSGSARLPDAKGIETSEKFGAL